MLLVIGAEYYEKCVGNDAALFLVVAGPIMIGMSLAALVAHLAKVHPVWFITDTSNFRLACPLELPCMVHATSLV